MKRNENTDTGEVSFHFNSDEWKKLKIGGIAAAIILTLCFTSFIDQQGEFERLSNEKQKLEAERDQLYLKYESLKGLDDIAESREYLERIARDYLGMAMPGDQIFVVD